MPLACAIKGCRQLALTTYWGRHAPFHGALQTAQSLDSKSIDAASPKDSPRSDRPGVWASPAHLFRLINSSGHPDRSDLISGLSCLRLDDPRQFSLFHQPESVVHTDAGSHPARNLVCICRSDKRLALSYRRT